MSGKTLVRLGILAVAALQVGLLLVIAVPKERTLASGETVVLQTVPVDPRDLFRGDYVVLRYTISSVRGFDFAAGDTVYVPLVKRGETWEALGASRSKPDRLFIKGRVTRVVGGDLEVMYGIENYFVPEGSGRVIERAGDLKVKAAVDGSGKAVIKELLVDGRPFDPSLSPETGPQEEEVPGEVPVPQPPPASDAGVSPCSGLEFAAFFVPYFPPQNAVTGRFVEPNVFCGTVMIEGRPAPDGTVVEALVGSEVCARVETLDGLYKLYVPLFVCPEDIGHEVVFLVGGVEASEIGKLVAPSRSWSLDLTVGR